MSLEKIPCSTAVQRTIRVGRKTTTVRECEKSLEDTQYLSHHMYGLELTSVALVKDIAYDTTLRVFRRLKQMFDLAHLNKLPCCSS
jgi:hypothetical protein